MRLAIFCYFEGKSVPSIRDMVEYLQQNLTWDVDIFNLMDWRTNSYEIVMPKNFNIGDYDGCLIHNSLAYDPNNVFTLLRDNIIGLKEFSGIKILFKQDENFKFKETDDLITTMGFDCVFTCLPKSELRKIYPKSLKQGVRFNRMFTGYVTPNLLAFAKNRKAVKKEIDVFYRGSIQPPEFGKLAVDKHRLGDKVANKLKKKKGIRLDISSFRSDRLIGEDWFEALSKSRATLGLESGASVFDIGDEIPDILAQAEKLELENDDRERFILTKIKHMEGNVDYAQIAPRHFEAAAMRSVQILYPGEYSGLLKKDIHYLELKEDLKNLNSIISKIKDRNLCRKMVNRAFSDIVENPDLHIDRLVEKLESELKKSPRNIKYEATLIERTKSNQSNFGFIICNHRPDADPRLTSMSQYSKSTIPILGMAQANEQREAKTIDDVMELSIPRKILDRSFLFSLLERLSPSDDAKVIIENILNRLIAVTYSNNHEEPGYRFSKQFENLNPDRKKQFQWYSNHTLEATCTFADELLKWKNFDFLICADLPTLLAGVIVSKIKKINLVYDAHEWWPFIEAGATNYEQEFWLDIESKLVKLADINMTVNPVLAEKMKSEYNVDFLSVCNCSPLIDKQKPKKSTTKQKQTTSKDKKKVKYIFQGGISEGRGLDRIIDIWSNVEDHFELYIRGPEGAEKEKLKAQTESLEIKNIFFLDAVHEDELISALEGYDVGVIPYGPEVLNQKFCCPNKMSQYMAAGMPVLANYTSFVGPFVREYDIGHAVKFEDATAVEEAVQSLANLKNRRIFSRNAKETFKKNYNWQSVSEKINIVFDGFDQSSRFIPVRLGKKPENLFSFFVGETEKRRSVYPSDIIASDFVSTVTEDYKYLAYPQNMTDAQRLKLAISPDVEEISFEIILSEGETANELLFEFESISTMPGILAVSYQNNQSFIHIEKSIFSSEFSIQLDISIKKSVVVTLSDFHSDQLIVNSLKLYTNVSEASPESENSGIEKENEPGNIDQNPVLVDDRFTDVLVLPRMLMPLKKLARVLPTKLRRNIRSFVFRR